jgi:hypothetical protein
MEVITVVEIVAVKALMISSEPQPSITRSQHIQSKAVNLTRFQQTSINGKNQFGTRGSEVQILSPRLLESTVYNDFCQGYTA